MTGKRNVATILGIAVIMVLAACTSDPTATPTATATPQPAATATNAPQSTPSATPTSRPAPTPPATVVPTMTATPKARPTLAPMPLPGESRVIVLWPSKDNTLYQSGVGSISNGAGQHIFVGSTNASDARRGVISFDVASVVPAGSTIVSAELTLNMSRSTSPASTIELHALIADWGEGESDAMSSEGNGTTAAVGDATWVHRMFPSVLWKTPGGDFSFLASAVISVGGGNRYTWNATRKMIADVQGWVDDPSADFGWLLLGNEATSRTAKRFDSKESPTAGNRPTLTITYELPVES